MDDLPVSTLVNRSIVVAGRRTSVRLEPTMWEALREIARRRTLSVSALVTEIDDHRSASRLTASIRVYIVDFYRAAAAESSPAWVEGPPPAWVPSPPM